MPAMASAIDWTILLPLVPYFVGTEQLPGYETTPPSVSVSMDGCASDVGTHDSSVYMRTTAGFWL